MTSASPEDPVLLLANVGEFGDVPALAGRLRGAYAETLHPSRVAILTIPLLHHR